MGYRAQAPLKLLHGNLNAISSIGCGAPGTIVSGKPIFQPSRARCKLTSRVEYIRCCVYTVYTVCGVYTVYTRIYETLKGVHPRGYVHQKCISVVLWYKEVRWPPYTNRSFGRSRRALPGATKKPLDSCKDTSVRAVGKFFYLRKIFYGCNGFSIKFYEGYPPSYP